MPARARGSRPMAFGVGSAPRTDQGRASCSGGLAPEAATGRGWLAAGLGRMEFEQVVAETDQGPLLLHACQAAAQELPNAARVFDLPEDGLRDGLPPRVEPVTA